MDGTKRKAPSPPARAVDLGIATPKWTAMADYPESALRYTQDPYALPLKRRNSIQKREEAIRAISPLTIDDGSSNSSSGSESEVSEWEVDTDNDKIRLINTGESTWSGTLDNVDDPLVQAEVKIALLHLKQAQSLAEVEANKLHSDQVLRSLVQSISNRLNADAVLTLERLTDDGNVKIHCAHPFCPSRDHCIPAGAYYFILGQPRQLQDAQHYCLFCLEEMWDGKGIIAPLPSASATTAAMALQSDLDGLALDGASDERTAIQRYLSGDCEACRLSLLDKLPPDETPAIMPASIAVGDIPASLLESRWAPRPSDGERPTTPEAQIDDGLPQSPETPGGPYSPVVRERTRFQHLAQYVQAGESLDENEKEAVRKWKEDAGFRGKELSVALGELRD